MSIFLEEEISRWPTGKQPPLRIPEIHGVRNYSGSRNPVSRSEVARRVSTTIATRATKGIPEVYHFESTTEYAVTLDALIDPRVFGIEVQLAPQKFYDRKAKKTRGHCFDLRLTFEDGYRRAVFIRNGHSLTKTQTKDEITDIFNDLSADFADDAIVVDGDAYTRPYRHNLYRVWDALQAIDHDADVKIEKAASSTCYWSIKDLIRNSTLPSPRAFAAILRLVGRGGLAVDWYSVICVHSRVLLKA